MKNLIYSNGLYAICQLDKKNLYELAEFVVRENYKHHDGDFSTESIREEIHAVYQEELQYFDNSLISATLLSSHDTTVFLRFS